ncbi:hypothetical protein ACQ4M3_02875 [Leptolyngbya sp. AN03gr2]|uniref:hypothetical protein n=1 Tax=unclassified Leptolyngbya TaxID=2650499 RepID=UPI003D321093
MALLIQLALKLSKKYRRRLHILHMSTAEEAELMMARQTGMGHVRSDSSTFGIEYERLREAWNVGADESTDPIATR